MDASRPRKITIGLSTSCWISGRSSNALQNWASERSFGTSGYGATKCFRRHLETGDIPMHVIVCGLVGTYPLGGVGWDYLQFVKGFLSLGCEVTYLEDTGMWVYDPILQTFTQDCHKNVQYLSQVLSTMPGMERSFAFRDCTGVLYGLSESELAQRCRRADMLLNISAALRFRDSYREARVIAYYDSDPLYSQAGVAADEREGKKTTGGGSSFRDHDVYFTMAENINNPSCRIPHCGVEWKTTRQPVTIEDWPYTYDDRADRFTTIMSWKTNTALPELNGRVYGGKDVEFLRFLTLPSRLTIPLEVAVSGAAPRAELQEHGWIVVDAWERSSTMNLYRDYIASSRGEWSVAKEAYVASGSGWFSCRSAVYLAMGKPVVLEDTGFSQIYPVGEGVWSFTTLEEATVALETVNLHYRRECENARALAETLFRAETVLSQLIRDAGL